MHAGDSLSLMPEEYVSGYLLRRAWAEGADQRRIRSALFGRTPALTSKYVGWRIVPNLDRENCVDVSIFSEAEALTIARSHSTAGVYLPTTHPDLLTSMAKLFERGSRTNSRNLPVGLEQVRKHPAHVRIRFCPACFRDQIAEYGVAYYRRSWAVPYIKNCLRHRIPLQGVGCPHCGGNDGIGDLRRNFEQLCRNCGADLWIVPKTRPTAFSLLADTWFEDLLTNPLPFLTHRDTRRLLGKVAEALDGCCFSDEMDHRCVRGCDPFSCTERVNWMLDIDGKIDGRFLIGRADRDTNYSGVPPFLLFWIPVIYVFGTLANLRQFFSEDGRARDGNDSDDALTA